MDKVKVLVVEDDMVIGESIMSALRQQGYSPIALLSKGEQAIELIRQDKPDIILLDITLKGKYDGIKTAKIIREEIDIPIIYTTAYTNPELFNRAKETFPYGYIVKPFTGNELVANIEMALFKHKAEKNLEASEKKYRQIFDLARDVLYISTSGGELLDINPAGREFLHLKDRNLAEINIPEQFYKDPKKYQEQITLLKSQGYYQDFEVTLQINEKEERIVFDSAIAEKDQDGNIVLIRGAMHDITRLRELEADLRQAQKMEALGALAGGIAHDFNNVLTTILGFAQMGAMKTEDKTKVNTYFKNIIHSAERASQMTKQILAFSRRQHLEFTNVELNKYVEEEINLLKRLIPETIRIEIVPFDEKLNILADQAALQQILMNLAVNARDAMPDGGILRIEMGKHHFRKGSLPKHEECTPGYYASLSVADTGIGIEKENLSRIFEPFFTTKSPGKGTGLGLSVVHGLVKQHGGFIRAQSEPGTGTTLTIFIPMVKPEEKEKKAEEDYFALPKGKGTILLVEDEDDIRKMSLWMLKTLGFMVIEASNGAEAIEILSEKKEEIDLIISDIVMPDKTGVDILNFVESEKLNIPMILITGYSSPLARTSQKIPEHIQILKKPFTIMILGEKIKEVLSE